MFLGARQSLTQSLQCGRPAAGKPCVPRQQTVPVAKVAEQAHAVCSSEKSSSRSICRCEHIDIVYAPDVDAAIDARGSMHEHVHSHQLQLLHMSMPSAEISQEQSL